MASLSIQSGAGPGDRGKKIRGLRKHPQKPPQTWGILPCGGEGFKRRSARHAKKESASVKGSPYEAQTVWKETNSPCERGEVLHKERRSLSGERYIDFWKKSRTVSGTKKLGRRAQIFLKKERVEGEAEKEESRKRILVGGETNLHTTQRARPPAETGNLCQRTGREGGSSNSEQHHRVQFGKNIVSGKQEVCILFVEGKYQLASSATSRRKKQFDRRSRRGAQGIGTTVEDSFLVGYEPSRRRKKLFPRCI